MPESLFFNKVVDLRPATLLKKRLWHRCFPVNFAKFLRTPFLQNTSGRLRLIESNFLSLYSLTKQFSIFLCSLFYFLLKTFSFIIDDVFEKSKERIFSFGNCKVNEKKINRSV